MNSPSVSTIEPAPGARLTIDDFATVVRLTPLISVDLIVRDPAGQILLGMRRNEPARDSYFVPGGRITKNERLADAFQRLTQMELGLPCRLADARFLGVFDHIYDRNFASRPGFGTHYVVLAYELSLSAGQLNLPADQHGAFVWKSPVEILDCPAVHANTRAYFLPPPD